MWKSIIFVSIAAEISGVLLFLVGGLVFLLGNNAYVPHMVAGIIILIIANLAYFLSLRHRPELKDIAYGLLDLVKLFLERKTNP